MSAPTRHAGVTAKWERLYEDVKTQIPAVTDAVIKQMFYQIWNDFCDRTNIWVEVVPINVDPSTSAYPFTVQNKGMPNRLMLVYDPQVGPPFHWVMGGIGMAVPGVITLIYPPSSAATWNVVVAKTADEVDSDGWPDLDDQDNWIIDKYIDGMHYGVLARLQMMPGKPYSNPKMANVNWQYYTTERGKARTDALHSNAFDGQRWQFPQAFAVSRRKGWV